VNALCTLATTVEDGGYNRCYNKLALRYHNEQRALRVETKNLELDPAIARYIQTEMEKAAFTGTSATAGTIPVANRGPWAGCGESVYKRPSSSSSSS
jgi:hypothetical protein